MGQLLFCLLLVLSLQPLIAAESIKLYTYHVHPPFVTAADTGLSYDLADYLTQHSGGRYHFKVVIMSRPRVDKILSAPISGAVPWVNPAWFAGLDNSRHLWTQNSLMKGANVILSRQARPVTYFSPTSLDGLVLGGVRGRRYAGIDTYIQEKRTIRRINANGFRDNIEKLLDKNIDVMVIPLWTASYFLKDDAVREQLFVSPTPQSSYQRRFLVLNSDHELKAHLDQMLAKSRQDREWVAILDKYRS